MFKKLSLVVLLSISGLKASDAPTTGYMQSLKDSHGLSMWAGVIIPSVLAIVSSEVTIRANADNPDRKDIVLMSRFMQWASMFMGAFFLDQWVRFDFRDYFIKNK